MRILVIDDDTGIRQFLKESLESEGFIVDTAGNGVDGSYMARVNVYDAVILDYVMPKKNGMEVLKDIRTSGKTVPVIMLSVQGDIDDKTGLLDLGADDYLTKPFSFKELLSRIRALIRRPKKAMAPVLKSSDLKLDTINHKAFRGSKEIYLTRKEFALAEFMMINDGSIVSRSALIDHVWNSEVDSRSNTIEVHIRNLRKKIDDGFKRKLIHTVPGRGYLINQ